MDLDLSVALNPDIPREERFAAWHRYEVERWFQAYRKDGLLLTSLEWEMRKPVYERICMDLDAKNATKAAS